MKNYKLLMLVVFLSISPTMAHDIGDLKSFSADWLKTGASIADPNWDYNSDSIVNFKDFAIFAGIWQNPVVPPPVNQAPVAYDVNVAAIQYVTSTFSLPVTDDNLPWGHLFYFILSLPDSGYLQDAGSTNPVILPGQLPYFITNLGNTLNFISGTLGTTSFTYKAWDGPGGLYSNIGTVNITVSAPAAPYISLQNNGYIVAAPNDFQNLQSGWAVQTTFKTQMCSGTILSKRADGAGWDLQLIQGRLQFDCYDANGYGASQCTVSQINTGQWMYVSVACKATAVPQAQLKIYDKNNNEIEEDDFNIPNLSDPNRYKCNAPLIFVSMFDGSIARTRFFSNIDPTDKWNWIITISPAIFPFNLPTETVASMGIGIASNMRWMMTDGAGTTVAEDKLHFNGTIIEGSSPDWHEPLRIYFKDTADLFEKRTVQTDCNCNSVFRERSSLRIRPLLKKQQF